MNNLKLFENFNDNKESMVFEPSGEIFDLTPEDIKLLDDFVMLDYDVEYESYVLDDTYKEVVILVLNSKKKKKENG